MRELVRTNDVVLLSFLQALLRDAGIEGIVFDTHTSIMEGSIGAIQRRLMVIDEDYDQARELVADSGHGAELA
jgi:hypothetical protein